MKKLVRRGVHELVIEEIGSGIIAGDLLPGATLPSEAELCAAMAVSRTGLREALRVLAAKGLVEARPKIGTLVRAREHWNYLDADILAWRLRGRDADSVIGEIYELRHLIEPVAAALAAKNGSTADLETMLKAYRDMEAAGDNGVKITAPDLKFHRAIIEASGNRLFSSLAHVLQAALSINFDLVRDAPRGHRHSMPAHRKVLEAIAHHDANAARVAMQELIEDSQRDARAVRRAGGRRGAAASKPRKPSRTG